MFQTIEMLFALTVTFDLQSFMAVLMAAMGIAQAGTLFPDIGKAKAAVGRVFPILDRVPSIDVTSEEGETPATVKGEVHFEGVKFAYPSRPSVVIYRDFTLAVPAGQMCALVGESGSGKSTVVSLLQRFYGKLALFCRTFSFPSHLCSYCL